MIAQQVSVPPLSSAQRIRRLVFSVNLFDNGIGTAPNSRKEPQWNLGLAQHAGRTKLSICEDLVEHYWSGPRTYYHYQMRKLVLGVLRGAGIGDSNMQIMRLESLPKAALRHKLAMRLKRLQRAAGPEYGFACLGYLSALSVRQTDSDHQMSGLPKL